MTTPLLVDVEDVKEAAHFRGLGLSDLDDAILSAIRVSQLAVIEHTRHPVQRVTVVDEFADVAVIPVGDATRSRLALSRGLVDTGQTISVITASSRLGLDESTAEDLRDQNGDDLVAVNAVMGLVSVYGFDLTGLWVRVSYTAGLTGDDGDPEAYNAVPTWLRNAVILRTLIRLSGSPTIPAGSEKKGGNTIDVKSMKREYDHTVGPWMRYLPQADAVITFTETAA